MSRLKDVVRPYVLAARRIRHDPPTLASVAWAQQRSFSQFGEDRFLLRYFGAQPAGFYVDVGAYHPFSFSNTYLLYRRGWSGINLEPAPEALSVLKQHRPRDICLPLAVSSRVGSAPFSLSGAFAGILDEHRMWDDMGAGRITVETDRLANILDRYLPKGRSIDLLDVDCEGNDLDVLLSNDWDRYRPRLVLAEAHDADRGRQLSEFLRTVNYAERTRLELTIVFESHD